MNEQKLDELFSSFTAGQQSTIRELYNIMPSLSADQQRSYLGVMAIAQKWQLQDVQQTLLEFIKLAKSNRSLGALPSFKHFLKAVTLEEQLRGIKIQAHSRGES